VPITLLQLIGAYLGANIAKIVYSTLQKFSVTPYIIGYFVLNNAYNNNTIIRALTLKIGFNATY
jgi:hypothetical protein